MEKVVLSKGYEYELVPNAVGTGSDSVSVTFLPGEDTAETLETKWAGNDNIKIIIGDDEIRNFSGYRNVKSVLKTKDYVINVITTTDVSATTTVDGSVTVDDDTFLAKLPNAGVYTFYYDLANTTWTYGGIAIDLADYGITLAGTPVNESSITVVVTKTTTEEKADVFTVTCVKPDLSSRMADAEDSIENLINTVLG